MATRKMTFTLPEELAERFTRQVPAYRRSGYLSDALATALSEQERRLIEACEIANAALEARTVEAECDALRNTVDEP